MTKVSLSFVYKHIGTGVYLQGVRMKWLSGAKTNIVSGKRHGDLLYFYIVKLTAREHVQVSVYKLN